MSRVKGEVCINSSVLSGEDLDNWAMGRKPKKQSRFEEEYDKLFEEENEG